MSNNMDTVNALMQVVQMLQQDPRQNRQGSDQPSTPAVITAQDGQASLNSQQNASQAASVSASTASTSARAVDVPTNSRHLEEHRRLFSRQSRVQPYSRQISGRRRRAPAKKEKSLTKTMFCFAEKGANEAPSSSEKLLLLENGLGEKRVSFPVSATAANVKEVLYGVYPALRFSGGFQILVSQEKARKQLKVVSHGCCSTEQLRCFGNGRIYVRPLQRSIPLTESVRLQEEREHCLSCGETFSVSEMRDHLRVCERHNSSDEDETEERDENVRSGIISQRNDVVQVADDEALIENTTSLPLNDQIAVTQPVSTGSADGNSADGSDLDSIAPTPRQIDVIEITDTNRTELENSPEFDPLAQPYEEHLRNAIDATLTATTLDAEPVRVLRTFLCHFLRGRPLDIKDPTVALEGETTDVFVTRENLYEDGMDELLGGLGVNDPSLPLEVTFTGECAQDLGGPRKEFLGVMTREIKDSLFVASGDSTYILREDVVAENRRYFFGAGLIFGYSMLQGGPLPCFMHEDLITKLFGVHAEELNAAEEQLRDGFSKFGLVELIKKRPSMLFLLRRTACNPLTYPRIIKMFVPTFSEQGSNKRMQENKTYRLFLNYVKEVAAGRRENVSLGDVLRFATCSEDEPVLGFALQPTLCFSDSMPSCLPTCNTCINLLRLAIGERVPDSQDEMFQKFDLAFTNTHFGLV